MSKTFLAIEAHADDAAIGAGPLLIEAARRGHRVVVVTVVSDFTTWRTSIGREEAVRAGLNALAAEYGFERIWLDRPYHRTAPHDTGLKQELATICADVSPDVAFIHHHEDHWPDHAASGIAAKDALMFPHGLGPDIDARTCPLIYAFDISPRQTYRFEPDAFYDISDLMPDFMTLIMRTAVHYFGTAEDEISVGTFRYDDGSGRELKLCSHGLKRFADCVRFGNLSRCSFALGLRTVWGSRRGEGLY